MHSKFVSRASNNMALMGAPQRSFRKSYNTSYYNQRFQPSQGKDNMYWYSATHIQRQSNASDVSTAYL